jgi:hypothetical protein
MGRRILDVVAPEIGEAQEAKALAAEERQAEQSARLTMHDAGHGVTHGRFAIPTHVADQWRKGLQAIASPRAGGEGATPHGMGLALVEYVPAPTLAHHPAYEMRHLPGGKVAFTRRERALSAPSGTAARPGPRPHGAAVGSVGPAGARAGGSVR